MCHHMTWEEWKRLSADERAEHEEPRVEATPEPEHVEGEPELDREREFVRA